MLQQRSVEIRRYIIEHLQRGDGSDLAVVVAGRFKISRQAAGRHIAKLVAEGVLQPRGKTRSKTYNLVTLFKVAKEYSTEGLEEHIPWMTEVRPCLTDMPENVMQICSYVFTEILNNAIDHSASTKVRITCTMNAATINIQIMDQGVGIFKKIKEELQLADERQAILELTKGKFTTDRKRHSGEGIFFSSRAVDEFLIWSHDLCFKHVEEEDDWLHSTEGKYFDGTLVDMTISKTSGRSLKEMFARFQRSPDDLTFSKTHVPIKLAQLGSELMSRSQARRVMSRLEGFDEVMLDFTDVVVIGQAFADEIFRVFANEHPSVQILHRGATDFVGLMIQRAKDGAKRD